MHAFQDVHAPTLYSAIVDSDGGIVATEHRQKLLPVLIRILYGRMQRQGGHNTSKAGGAGRRGLVLRFLGSNCEGDELKEFIQLMALPFNEITEWSEVDMSGVVPLKKQQGFLNMLGQMITIISPSLLLPHLPRLLTIITHLASSSAKLLDKRDQLAPHHVNALKALRQLSTYRIRECFERFIDFDFSPLHENLLSCIVWPQLFKLSQENIQSPTPLLKLLSTWTAHPQYWYLLTRSIPPSCSLPSCPEDSPSVLKYVFDCLSSPKASTRVCSFIMDMVVNLLILAHQEMTMEVDGLEECDTERDIDGTNLITPYIPRLLEYLSRVIHAKSKGKKNGSSEGGGSMNNEFVVLSRLSSFIEDPNESSSLIKLLLPFLQYHSEQHKKHEESILQAISNLVVKASQTSQFIRPLSQLFKILTETSSRKMLCLIFLRLAETNQQWTKTAEIISKLNSWRCDRLDEPDYDKRLKGFLEEAKEMLASVRGQGERKWSASMIDSVYPILQNALFFLKYPDMSIRHAAASYIGELVKCITSEDGEVFELFVLTSMVTAIKEGLRSKQEVARDEFISLLSSLIQNYSHHPRLSDMATLSNKDPEADFFKNVVHIQLHRRTRAFRKLAKVCSEGVVGQTNCLNFLLPLANHVVFTPSTNTEQNLLAEAVNVIGAISRQLSWTNYSFILGHYLRQLSKSRDIQKNLIKVVIIVLDNFHFDLSLVTTDSNKLEEAAPTCSRNTKVDDTKVDDDQTMEKSDDASNETGVAEEMEVDDGMMVGIDKEEKEGSSIEEEQEEVRKKALAQKIYRTIVKTILPHLQEVLTKKVDLPGHKLSRPEQDVNSEVLRVPVAMAMTKLLLALPEDQLHLHLPNLLLKVCVTLKNRSRDVRDIGRSTLVKMATSLGPKYLKYIIREMKDSLTRGYMLHVLSYSLHYLLRAMSTPTSLSPTASFSSPSCTPSPPSSSLDLTVGSLDPCLQLISDILIEDLFGAPAEERESGENVAKIPESKTPQSYNTYEIVSQFLSPKLLSDLLSPVKEMLECRSNSRTCRIVEEVFRRATVGIQKNQAFTPQALLIFIHRVISDSIPQLSSKPQSKPPAVDVVSKLHPPDSRLLPPNPGRSGPRPISLGNMGASIITEFGLQLFHVALKRGKFNITDNDQIRMLDPFVPLLTESLSSPHTKVLCRTLQCLVWIVRLPLPSLETHINQISTHLFELLRQYARAGMAVVGSNRELVLSAFKAVTVVVRDFKKHDITEDELRILLSFVEEDIHDYQRQSTAFPLLKAILGRKLIVGEIYEIVQKVATLSVTSDSEHVRLQCRQAVLQFLMDYPLGKKLNKYLDFHVQNLSYEEQSGRESVLEQLNSIFAKFPPRLLNRHATYFFIPLASRLLNEESPTCRRMVAAAIKALMSRLDTVRSNEVASVIKTWIKDRKLLHKRIGMQALGLLAETESQSFIKRLSVFLPLLQQCMLLHKQTDKDQEEDKEEEEEAEEGSEAVGEDGEMEEEKKEAGEVVDRVKALDHLLYSTLATFGKICEECNVIRSSELNNIWGSVHSLLLHPHVWVRLSSSQLFGLLFAAFSPEELVSKAVTKEGVETGGEGGCGLEGKGRKKGKKEKKRMTKEGDQLDEKDSHYIHLNTIEKVQDLSHLFCVQLNSPLLTAELANQAIKNLVFLAKVLHQLQLAGTLDQVQEVDSIKEKYEVQDVDKVQTFKQRMLFHDCSSGSEDEGKVGEGDRRIGERRRKDLEWLIGRMSRLARYEAGYHPKQSIKRMHVLQWIAAVSLYLGSSHLPSFLPSLLPPLHRELADTNHVAGKDLHSLSLEVVELLKETCGKDAFSKAYAIVQKKVIAVREKRRKQAVLEAVVNPEKSIFRKKRKNELKKATKRKRIFRLRPDGTAAAAASRKRKRLST